MPFDEEDEVIIASKKGLKQVSSQKSIFENMPQKPTQDDLDKKVKQIQEQSNTYKSQVADLTNAFIKMVSDHTLKQNKNIFAQEMEKEVLTKMINLAMEINNDPYEKEGMGSIGWIALLFRVCLSQRNRINQLEYTASILEKKCDPATISVLIAKELKALDKKKDSE